jgi:hypothetical protein
MLVVSSCSWGFHVYCEGVVAPYIFRAKKQLIYISSNKVVDGLTVKDRDVLLLTKT